MIVLKKEINAILEANKLPELTVDLQAGFLQIVGRKCGQPMMLINGISPAKKMTKDERQIVMDDYLIPVITTHKADFLAVISAKRAGKTLTSDMDKELEKINKTTGLRVVVNTAHDYNTSTSKLKISSYIDLPGDNGIGEFNETQIKIGTCTYKEFDEVKKLIDACKPKVKTITDIVEKINVNNQATTAAQAKLSTVCGW